MSEDQFTELFKYMERRFDGVEERLEREHEDHIEIKGAIVELSAQIRDYHHEMIFLSHQVDRLKDAILPIVRETGVKLRVEL